MPATPSVSGPLAPPTRCHQSSCSVQHQPLVGSAVYTSWTHEVFSTSLLLHLLCILRGRMQLLASKPCFIPGTRGHSWHLRQHLASVLHPAEWGDCRLDRCQPGNQHQQKEMLSLLSLRSAAGQRLCSDQTPTVAPSLLAWIGS